MKAENYTLTPAGWPRPRNPEGLPIPWVAPTHHLGEVNHGRRLSSVGGAVCQVCGLGFDITDGEVEDAYGFTTMTWNDDATGDLPIRPGEYLSALIPGETRVILLDGAVMHLRCCRLTAAMCPHVRDSDTLICVRVPANDADPIEVDGALRPSYEARDVEYVQWPARRRPR